MGAAKLRGPREVRVQEGIRKEQERVAEAKRLEQERLAAMTPEQRERSRKAQLLIASTLGLISGMNYRK